MAADNLSLIKDLCQRLGFPCDTEQLESPRGLQSLLPQIQRRLSQLQEEDTYGNVEEIPTDSCPVVYTGPPRSSPSQPALRRPRTLGRVLNSIMESAISRQLMQMLFADLLTSLPESPSQLPSATSLTTSKGGKRKMRRPPVGEELESLITEVRSETLLSEVLLSVVRAASETAAAAAAAAAVSATYEEEEEEDYRSRAAYDGNKDDNGEVLARYTPSDQLVSCRSTAETSPTMTSASTTSFKSHGLCASTSSNAVQRRATAFGSATGSSQAAAKSGRRDTFSSVSSSTSRSGNSASSGFSGFPCYPSSAATAIQPPQTPWSAQRKASGSSSTRDSLSNTAIFSGGYGVAKVCEAGDGMRRFAHWKQQPIASTKVQPSLTKPAKPEEQDVLWFQKGDDQLESFSNIEARWRGRTIDERRRDFFWAVDDIYQHPYEGVEAVARDDWLFTGDRPGYCPMFARLNRARRDVMINRRKRDAKRQPAEQWASSPLELYNGVAHPLNPAAAPCRAAFVGD